MQLTSRCSYLMENNNERKKSEEVITSYIIISVLLQYLDLFVYTENGWTKEKINPSFVRQ